MSQATERSMHPSMAQINNLVDMLERNPDVAKGYLKTQNAKKKSQKFWENAALQLNSIGGGTFKDWKKWMKYWSDKRSALKKKSAQRAAERRRTGGSAGEVVELSSVEEKMLALLGGEGFATGDAHLRIPLIHVWEPSTPHQDIPTQETLHAPIELDALGLGISPSILSENTNITQEPVAGTSYSTPNMSYQPPCMIEPEITTASQPSPPPHHTPPRAPRRRRRSTSRTSPTLTPRRRRLHARASPPSQRRTQFISITDRFLRVEERRMELEERNADLMRSVLEQSTQRDQAMVDAVTTMGNVMAGAIKALGDGLIALSDAFKST